MLFYLYLSLSFITALVIAKPVINFLKRVKSIQSFRAQGPQSHIEAKAGTPTMGAWIFLAPIFLFGVILYFQMKSFVILLVLLAFLVGSVMGAVDDGLKILQSNYKGLSSIQKLFIQILFSFAIAYFSGRYLFAGITDLPEWTAPAFVGFEFIWAFLVIAGSSNAINLTDGLDGLATSMCMLAYGALAYKFWQLGNFELMYFCVIVIAALAAFLIFNFKPAKIFMGDTGSLALGMGLGTLAYLAKLEWYLLAFALVPVLETLSVVLQVLSAQISRRFFNKDWRIFKMAPLHHHFELSGMPELAVVLSFSIFQIIVIILSLVIIK